MIKVTVGEQETQPFPKLMQSIASDLIVLFVYECKGFVLSGKQNHDKYEYRSDWVMASFSDYNLPITLQNETS